MNPKEEVVIGYTEPLEEGEQTTLVELQSKVGGLPVAFL